MAMLTLGTEAIMSRLNGRQQGIGKEARKKKKAKRRAVKQARRKHWYLHREKEGLVVRENNQTFFIYISKTYINARCT